jgi:glutathione synthase/RimK-type ligase-like ATP-grasp enzyme
VRFSIPEFPPPVTAPIMRAALARGHVVTEETSQAAYIRTTNYGQQQACREALAKLHELDIPTVPDHRFSRWYDDKREQVEILRKWSPDTHLIFSPDNVPKMDLPFVSKSSGGSGSCNIRLVKTQVQADQEVTEAFSHGIMLNRGDPQRGYLIWQRFIRGNTHDIRVVRCGDNLFGLCRGNRDDVPFASGSGRTAAIVALNAPKAHAAFEMTREITEALGLRWVCFDFVFEDDRPFCLEMSSSWTESSYVDCACFDVTTLKPNGHTAREWPDFAVDELEHVAA